MYPILQTLSQATNAEVHNTTCVQAYNQKLQTTCTLHELHISSYPPHPNPMQPHHTTYPSRVVQKMYQVQCLLSKFDVLVKAIPTCFEGSRKLQMIEFHTKKPSQKSILSLEWDLNLHQFIWRKSWLQFKSSAVMCSLWTKISHQFVGKWVNMVVNLNESCTSPQGWWSIVNLEAAESIKDKSPFVNWLSGLQLNTSCYWNPTLSTHLSSICGTRAQLSSA